MIVCERYAGTTNNLLVLGPGNNPDTTSGIFVKGTGLVGIGTDSPARILHLNGSDSDTVQLHITNSTTGPSGTDGVSFALGSDESLIINQRESNSILLKTADTTRLTITSDGDVDAATGHLQAQDIKIGLAADRYPIIQRAVQSSGSQNLSITGGSGYSEHTGSAHSLVDAREGAMIQLGGGDPTSDVYGGYIKYYASGHTSPNAAGVGNQLSLIHI